MIITLRQILSSSSVKCFEWAKGADLGDFGLIDWHGKQKLIQCRGDWFFEVVGNGNDVLSKAIRGKFNVTGT